MKKTEAELVTPVYLKTTPSSELPEDPAAYVLSSSGLYFCRNHPFFRSCVPAPRWPRELKSHSASLQLRYPKLSRAQFELIVGFFAKVAERHSAEAAVLLLYNHKSGKIRFHVPRQEATVSKGWAGKHYPIDLKYDLPTNLDMNLSLIGDIHSHADEAAYASYKDKQDEVHQAGVHIVVGRVLSEPIELHCEFVVDGYRFTISPNAVLEGYKQYRQDVPPAWFDRIEIRRHKFQTMNKSWNYNDSYQTPHYYSQAGNYESATGTSHTVGNYDRDAEDRGEDSDHDK
jgi:hypothetical protein